MDSMFSFMNRYYCDEAMVVTKNESGQDEAV
jgi:hypothetical protein